MTDPLLSSVLRLRTKSKNVAKTQVRNPYRRRKKAIKLTQDERRAKQVIQDAKKIKLTNALSEARHTMMGLAEDLAQQFPPHDKEYYYKLIMQLPTKKAHRSISQWCAYLSIRMEAHNDDITAENGEGAHRDRVTKDTILQKISQEWQALSPEQKHALTADKVKELEERRENRIKAVHNTNISACHDARITLKTIQTELENLHKRTGVATLLVATRGSVEAFGDPVVHYSDTRVQQFMEMIVGTTLEDTALQMEGYCISGVQAVVGNAVQRAQILRNQLGNLIFARLQDTVRRAKRGEVKRMNYVNFADAITVKFRVVAENWTTKFENTSGLSHMEVEIALRAWQSGTTRFRALTDEEWREWLEARFQSQDPSSTRSEDTPALTASNPSTPDEDAPATEDTVNTENMPRAPAFNESAVSTPVAENAAPEKRASNDAGVSAPPPNRVHAGPMSVSFINSAIPAAGQAFTVPKAGRKKRSDAGVPRGPRKKSASATSENIAPASAASHTTTSPPAQPAAQASKSRHQRAKQAAPTERNGATPTV